MSKVHGLRLSVLRPASGADCTLDGVSSKSSNLTLVGTIDDRSYTAKPLPPAQQGPFEPSEDAPAVALHVRNILGEHVASLVPVSYDGETGGWKSHYGYMAGGNFAVGDSRLTETIKKVTGDWFYGAVSIHDRLE